MDGGIWHIQKLWRRVAHLRTKLVDEARRRSCDGTGIQVINIKQENAADAWAHPRGAQLLTGYISIR